MPEEQSAPLLRLLPQYALLRRNYRELKVGLGVENPPDEDILAASQLIGKQPGVKSCRLDDTETSPFLSIRLETGADDLPSKDDLKALLDLIAPACRWMGAAFINPAGGAAAIMLFNSADNSRGLLEDKFDADLAPALACEGVKSLGVEKDWLTFESDPQVHVEDVLSGIVAALGIYLTTVRHS